MKCGAIREIKVHKKGKKKGKEYASKPGISKFVFQYGRMEYPKSFTQCDGRISVMIEAIDEPQWGYSEAVLNVEYKCEECGCQVFPELPKQDEDLSMFLEKVIENISEEERERIIKEEEYPKRNAHWLSKKE